MKTIRHILLAGLIIATFACNSDEQCRKENYLRFYAAFYHDTYNGTTKTTTTSSVSLKNITIQGIGSDSVLYNDTTLASIILPLHTLTGESDYRITMGSVSDTIKIFHTNFNTYLSLECGSIKTFRIDTVLTTNHFIKAIKIAEREVNTSTSAKENIKIYN